MCERYLVTGANGFIGAWVVRLLRRKGAEVVAFDLREDDHRHRLINDGAVPDVQWVYGDLTIPDDVVRAAEGATRIIHLAALQVPFCRANPIHGAAVNVTGTVNVFEAARQHGVVQISQASSIAVFDTTADYPNASCPPMRPGCRPRSTACTRWGPRTSRRSTETSTRSAASVSVRTPCSDPAVTRA